MQETRCDNCHKVLERKENTVSLYQKRIFTLTEQPHTSPFTHHFQYEGDEPKNYVKHFCSEGCIGEYYT